MNKNSTLSDMSFEDPIQKNNADETKIDYEIETDEDIPEKTKTPMKISQKKIKKEENNHKKKISKYQIHHIPMKINKIQKENDHFKLNKNYVIILLFFVLSLSIFFNVYLYRKNQISK